VRRFLSFPLLLACLLCSAPALAGGAGPTPHPIQALRAPAFPFANLGLWAQHTGFSLTRCSTLHDLAGGASLRIDERVRLTASYRMLGIDLGCDSDLESMDVEPGIAAPFLGLAFEY
jgi:hypothetical protein